jgi:hypothetical protein
MLLIEIVVALVRRVFKHFRLHRAERNAHLKFSGFFKSIHEIKLLVSFPNIRAIKVIFFRKV